MGESRQELLAWVNDLLQLNITKVEQFGTGYAATHGCTKAYEGVVASAALCQIYDSIFQDMPMARVKFNVNTEYAYLQNFKILQTCFTRHQIERLVPVEALIKCKMQDNLEFLQWSKRFWDQYYPGGDYDALARRKSSGPAETPRAPAPARTSGTGAAAARRGTTPTTAAARPARAAGGGVGSSAVAAENTQLKETVQGLERERDFYFSKLRDIELLIQQAIDVDPKIEEDEGGLEGFEIPAENEGGAQDDQETF